MDNAAQLCLLSHARMFFTPYALCLEAEQCAETQCVVCPLTLSHSLVLKWPDLGHKLQLIYVIRLLHKTAGVLAGNLWLPLPDKTNRIIFH